MAPVLNGFTLSDLCIKKTSTPESIYFSHQLCHCRNSDHHPYSLRLLLQGLLLPLSPHSPSPVLPTIARWDLLKCQNSNVTLYLQSFHEVHLPSLCVLLSTPYKVLHDWTPFYVQLVLSPTSSGPAPIQLSSSFQFLIIPQCTIVSQLWLLHQPNACSAFSSQLRKLHPGSFPRFPKLGVPP